MGRSACRTSVQMGVQIRKIYIKQKARHCHEGACNWGLAVGGGDKRTPGDYLPISPTSDSVKRYASRGKADSDGTAHVTSSSGLYACVKT